VIDSTSTSCCWKKRSEGARSQTLKGSVGAWGISPTSKQKGERPAEAGRSFLALWVPQGIACGYTRSLFWALGRGYFGRKGWRRIAGKAITFSHGTAPILDGNEKDTDENRGRKTADDALFCSNKSPL